MHAAAGETVFVPIPVRHNPGLMGFKLTVTYDAAALEPTGITAGTLTGSGMLNDSIGVTPQGAFTILWSDAQNAKGDGTLAVLAFKAREKAEGQTDVKLAYSAADTFNEKWEDVPLDCAPITVVFDGKAQSPDTVKPPDSRDILSAAQSAESTDVSAVNEALRKMTGTENAFADAEELHSAYVQAVQEVFADSVLQAVDTEKIDAVITDALQAVDAQTTGSVPAEKQAAFVQDVQTRFAAYAQALPSLSGLEPAQALEAIRTVQEKNKAAKAQAIPVPESPPEKSGVPAWVWIAAAVLLIAAISVFAVYHRKNTQNTRRNTNEKTMESDSCRTAGNCNGAGLSATDGDWQLRNRRKCSIGTKGNLSYQ